MPTTVPTANAPARIPTITHANTLEETAEFANALAPPEPGLPLAGLLRDKGRQLMLAIGAASGAVMLVYQASTFLTGYAESHLHFSRPEIFAISALGGVAMMTGTVASGLLTDRVGRRTLASLGYGIAVPWSLMILPLSQTGDPVLFAVAVTVTYAIVGVVMAPLTTLIPSVSRAASLHRRPRWPTISVLSWAARCRR